MYHGSRADSVCELNELNRLGGTSFPTPLDDDGGRSHQNDATAVYVRQNSELQAELTQSRQQSSKRTGSTQAGSTSSTGQGKDDRSRRESQATSRCSRCVARLECTVFRGELAQRCRDCMS